VVAAEVHQNAAVSGDIMWGMKLTSIRALPLAIAREPLDLAVEEGQTAELSVEVTGGPVFYQWYRDGAAVANATNATLKISSVTAHQAGRYFVTASNSISFLTSQAAFLDVVVDRSGPRLLSAVTVTTLGVTNTIDLTFSEPLLQRPQTKDLANFSLTRLATGAAVSMTNVAIAVATVRLRVDVADPDWILNEPYYLTVNHVRDWHTNVIAPDSRIGLGWRETRLMQSSDALWDYHAAARFDPQVYDEPWTQADYQAGPWWAQGRGGFGGVLGGGPACLGELLTAVGFQPEPILFRSAFVWPSELPAQAQMRFSTRAIDGLVLYLNGTEAYRFNVGPGPVRAGTRALANASMCFTNTQVEVTNLVAGQNWLAAAVVASAVSVVDEDMAFELEMHATTFRVAPLPANPPPRIEVTADGGGVRLFWEGAGYALETAVLLGSNAGSQPVGPWQEVPDMTNPYFYSVTNLTDQTRFFRLKR
jgi:hypothetical protein